MPFLKNLHHNLFEGKPLQLKNFTCKDCTQKKKEYEYQSDQGVLPKEIQNLGYIEISLNNNNQIIVTTPTMVCPFGFNRESNQMYLQFTNVKTDPSLAATAGKVKVGLPDGDVKVIPLSPITTA